MKRPVVFALLFSLCAASVVLSAPGYADWRHDFHFDRDRDHDVRYNRSRDSRGNCHPKRFLRGHDRYNSYRGSHTDRITELQNSVIAYQARVDKQRRNRQTNTDQYASDVYNLQSVQDKLNRLQGGGYRYRH